MTHEEKQLLLKDLCARLKYGVKFTLSGDSTYTMKGIDLIVTDEGDWEYAVTAKGIEPIEIKYIKPYLRPMSSMTEIESADFALLQTDFYRDGFLYPIPATAMTEWLDKHFFDYRDLIPAGLALEAPEGMYKTDTEEEEVKVEIPNTVEEALAILDNIVSEEDKEYLKENGAISAHLSLGMWIRNNWGFWENSDFYKYLCEKTGLTHPDDISNYIIEEFIKTI